MTKNFAQVGAILLVCLMVILEKGLFGTFVLFNIIPISLVMIILLLNHRSTNTYISVLFIYGLLIDLLLHRFLGLTSLVYSISLYLFYTSTIRFRQNKLFLGLTNLVFSLVLCLGYYGFENYRFWEVYIGTFIVFAVSSTSWLRK